MGTEKRWARAEGYNNSSSKNQTCPIKSLSSKLHLKNTINHVYCFVIFENPLIIIIKISGLNKKVSCTIVAMSMYLVSCLSIIHICINLITFQLFSFKYWSVHILSYIYILKHFHQYLTLYHFPFLIFLSTI